MQFKQAVSNAFSRQAANYASYCYGEKADQSLQAQAAALIQPYLQPCDVLLDLGCGPAVHTAMLRNYCRSYWGLDISPAMLDIARQSYEKRDDSVVWFEGDAEALCLMDQSVDTIFSNMAVQWCESPRSVLSEALRVLKPGGRLLLTTLAKESMKLLSDLHEKGLLNHTSQYPDSQVWIDAAESLGFKVFQAEHTEILTQHESPIALLKSLKQIGANAQMRNGMAEQHRQMRGQGLKTKNWLFQLYREIEMYRVGHSIPLNYRVLALTLVKGG